MCGAILWGRNKAIDMGEWSICGGGRLERFYSTYIPIWLSVFLIYIVGCTDLSGKKLLRQVGVGILVTSGKPTWCNG